MPFSPIPVVNGSTPINATWGNNAQTQYTEAVESFQADLFSGYVQSGLVATKDGSIANQLDVTAGVAYVQQADFTKRVRNTVSTNFTTSAISSTYHLYVQPDGTFYWNTANSPATGSLSVAQVTTDGSGNILAVTDTRNLNPTLLPNLSGQLTLPPLGTISAINGQATAGGLGVAPIASSVVRQHITSTAQQTIASVTPPVTAIYRVQGFFTLQNGSSGQKVAFGVNFTDPDIGLGQTQYFAVTLPAYTLLEGGLMSTTLSNAGYATNPWIIATSTAGLSVFFQDLGGTPSDHVTVLIERVG